MHSDVGYTLILCNSY